MRSFTMPRTGTVWSLNGKAVQVFTQTVAPDGGDTLHSMVYIEWSPKLTMCHNGDLTLEQAIRVANNVGDAGAIDVQYWTKCIPNDPDHVDAEGNPAPRVNPYYPFYMPMTFEHEREEAAA